MTKDLLNEIGLILLVGEAWWVLRPFVCANCGIKFGWRKPIYGISSINSGQRVKFCSLCNDRLSQMRQQKFFL